MNNREEILKLNHGESYIIPESDYGKAEIYNLHDRLILFQIPMYGGNPVFVQTYWKYEVDSLIKEVESWT